MKFTIAVPEKISTNKIYAGVHWSIRKRFVDDMHLMVLASKIPRYDGPLPVECRYRFRLNGPLLDSSNTTALGKITEDGLVRAGVLEDDNPKFVSWFCCKSEKAGKGEEDTVEVEFIPAMRHSNI
ncbi:MAG: hypothetical protein C0429_09790 [Sphingopyxis sp.]|nr:hypothetical protein [Sphingopyxis sp.]